VARFVNEQRPVGTGRRHRWSGSAATGSIPSGLGSVAVPVRGTSGAGPSQEFRSSSPMAAVSRSGPQHWAERSLRCLENPATLCAGDQQESAMAIKPWTHVSQT
jgi:hypothetical protein